MKTSLPWPWSALSQGSPPRIYPGGRGIRITLYYTKDFYHLPEQVPAWEKFYHNYLEKAYVNNTDRLMSLLTMDALSRYRLLLEQAPMIVQRLPNKLVASYINISQATLSRLKSKV